MTITGDFSAISASAHTDDHNASHSHIHEEVSAHQGHSHSESGEFWEEFWALMGSPAHWAFEAVTSVVFYLVFGLILYRLVLKNIMPRFRNTMDEKLEGLHEELDKEHGVEHPEGSPISR